MADYIAFIRSFVEKELPIPDGIDVLSFNFLKSGYVDSIEIFAFIVSVEEKFNIEISNSDMEKEEIYTIGGLAHLIDSKVMGKSK